MPKPPDAYTSAVELLAGHEIVALRFLEHGPHTMDPTVKDDAEAAAALLLADLTRRGLALCTVGDFKTRGPTYTITTAGRRALDDMRMLANAGS